MNASTPKYQQLAEVIRRQIASGELGVDARLPSFLEMRTQFGATPTTVERVYSCLEREGLIRREARRGVFVAQKPVRRSGAPRESKAKTGLIGFIGDCKVGRDLYSDHIMDGMQQVVGESGKQIVLLDGQSSAGLEKIEGLVICSTCHSEPVLRQLPLELPRVSLIVSMEDTYSVVADDCGGAQSAVEYLIARGHRRIACMMEFTLPLPRLRLAGYYDALAEAEIALNPRWMRQPRQIWQAHSGYTHWGREGMREWLRDDWEKLGCSAIFVQNDSAAMGVIEALNEAGISVPAEVSVIGFDGTELYEYSSPRLTSVEVPLRQIATTATEELLSQIEADRAAEPQTVTLPTKLKERESVAALIPTLAVRF